MTVPTGSGFGVSFNTQPPEGGWTGLGLCASRPNRFNTQPPEGGWMSVTRRFVVIGVSTHSRPKAAGLYSGVIRHHQRRFNTQPPEGGWAVRP